MSTSTALSQLRSPKAADCDKLLAYADDLPIFLSSPSKLAPLLSLLSVYSKASNACVNLGKTIAVSLSGHFTPDWGPVLSSADITNLYNHNSANAICSLASSTITVLSSHNVACLSVVRVWSLTPSSSAPSGTFCTLCVHCLPSLPPSAIPSAPTFPLGLVALRGIFSVSHDARVVWESWTLRANKRPYNFAGSCPYFGIHMLGLTRFSPATALTLRLYAIWTFLPPFSIPRWNLKGIYVHHAFRIDSQGGLYSPQPVDGLFSLVSLIQIDSRPLYNTLTGSLQHHLLTSPSSLLHAVENPLAKGHYH
ncbi:hypothetical protein PHYBLDRAFT_144987 [Phycomyces blakesleeanus NRRL 1555(-)]|uniref:Reverse transcriptase domain-containing protein n=1 Tax=Phycomyces blakesleeanus (strain ATCC 8743b / DSM 1359 / FGSC 10004 / NBRC 33097 / NRRL 1555) TaxID=763407 RepID=A0A163AMM8_PHYB8|nr:hypothetical protein PHYBLDRAFT_144987 [Phycomyces blakesleeanus NRRL 1555(-)]OAD74551.1 hypothetical protein PHYBLDRAFT_144987 [Phycomyces blakesleeanus NRRL 1555(-)]|eukprot:XP_018292591.1 hypothetical protein PHYBLDRAFT_144987 [Phycomyces blakesleeanus NRRL 1555(-)]